MGILVDRNTPVIVQGITGKEGNFHTGRMIEYGTNIVGGVVPGKGGTVIEIAGKRVPVYNTCNQAEEDTGAAASVIFVPPPFAADAVLEAVDAEFELIVCITEGIPVLDAMKMYNYVQDSNSMLIGPNCPGLVTVGEAKLGIMPGHIFKQGGVGAGIISRSGTLTYELVDLCTRNGISQTTCIGIGGDPIIGTTFSDLLYEFDSDPDTGVILLVGEIGGSDEEEAAQLIEEINTPVVAFVSGRTAPKGKRMGHAGAIISGNKGTAESKVMAFEAAGVTVAPTLHEMVFEARKLMVNSK